MKNIAVRSGVHVESGGESLISTSGASLLLQTASVSGLAKSLSKGLAPWRKPLAVHDPAKMILDLAVAIAVGGDCLADVALLRAQPEIFGPVASDPTISRLLNTLAADADETIAAIRRARATARSSVWERQSPLADQSQVIIDLDATLIGSHSEKELASPNYKRGFGFHPMMAFVHHIHDLGLRYSVGVYGRQPVLDALAALPAQAWKRALDADGRPREGARVAELTRWLPATFTGWPPGMRVIARKERPHPGAQLRITDDNGWRITVFATNTKGGRLAELEVEHRLRARCEDRIRNLKDTGATNLPLQSFDKNQIWLELCCLASELIVWTQTLAFQDLPVRLWEPKRLRLRLLAVAGRIITTARRRILRLPKRWPWTGLIIGGHRRLTMIT